jgi:CDP-diacylglycerol--serine O-phosphatidyltransferase
VRFTYIVLIVVAIVCIALHPAAMLLTLFGCYALSAPLLWLYRKLLRKRTRSVPQT